MYYEEKWIKGRLYFKITPEDDWEEFTQEMYANRVKQRESEIALINFKKEWSDFMKQDQKMKKHDIFATKKPKSRLCKAIPPPAYVGIIDDWKMKLQERGLWDGKDPIWYGHVMITKKQWQEIVDELDKERLNVL